MFLLHHGKNSGIYNLGSGKARTFNDLARAVFHALNKPVDIEYMDTPADIRDKYQYFTEAEMHLCQGFRCINGEVEGGLGMRKSLVRLKRG
jgi:nucleoside-diphosphate-sugar epimerase